MERVANASFTFEYPIEGGDNAMRETLTKVAKSWNIISGGIDSVSVIGGNGNASINSDTLFINFGDSVDTSTFITAASINSGEVDIKNNTLFIEIPETDTSTFITAASINSGSVSIDNNTLFIDIPTISADTDTFISQVSIVGGDISASIDSGILYLLTADSTPKSSATFSITSSADIYLWNNATIHSSHLGDGVVSNFAIPENCAIETVSADTFVVSGTGEGTADFILSETEQYYSAVQSCRIVQATSGHANTLIDMPLAVDFSNSGSATITTSGSYSFEDNCLKITSGYEGGWNFGLNNIGGQIKPFAIEVEVFRIAGAMILFTEPFIIQNMYFVNQATGSSVYFHDTALNTWLKYKIVFYGDKARLYLNNQLLGELKGSINQPVSNFGFATSNYYRNLKYIEAV